MKISSLKKRVLLWFGSIVTIVLLLFSFSFYYFLKQSIWLKLQTNLYERAEQIEADILADKPLKQILKNNNFQDLDIAIIKEGRATIKNRDFELDKSLYSSIKNDKFFMHKSEQYIKGIYILVLEKPFSGKLFVSTPKINNTIEDVEDTLLVINPLLLMILLFLGSKLIDKILIPVKTITQTAQKITVNNFSNSIPIPKEEDEIKSLVLSFNEMIQRLKEGTENLDRFNSDVSHELKTPLTVIRGEIEVILRKPREADEYKQSLQTISYESQQIEHIVENLLFLTKYSKQNIKETFEDCLLDNIVLNAIEKYDTVLKQKNINLQIDKLESITIKANPLLLNTIFSNLIDNAIKYTQKDKNISISLYKNDKVHFVIKDEGIGIEKKNLSKITDRFYRVDISRNKNIKGFGLGLAIVKNSVELHNAKIKVSSTLGKGTTVDIVFNIYS